MKSADFARGGLPLIDAAPPCGRLPAEKYFFRKRGFRKNDVNLFAAGALQPLPGGSGTVPAACAEGDLPWVGLEWSLRFRCGLAGR